MKGYKGYGKYSSTGSYDYPDCWSGYYENSSYFPIIDHGTGLTNFDKEDLFTYEESIRRFDAQATDMHKGSIYIKKKSMGGTPEGMYSLHCNKKSEQTSIFWDIFNNVKVEYPTTVMKMLSSKGW